tara:strand:+ start:687 stop:1256 length:570 start_codon:yes stop_codon:yes gene_type:complete
MYKVLGLAVLIFISGCATKAKIGDPFVKGYTYVLHPEYGEVLTDHVEFKKDTAECESLSYGEGVVIKDKLVTNRIELSTIEYKYSAPFLEKLKEEHKELDVSYAHEGAKVALAVTSGTAYTPSKAKYKVDYKKIYGLYEDMDHPEYINKIIGMGKKFKNCFREEKKWKHLRTEWVDTRNGDVIHVTVID